MEWISVEDDLPKIGQVVLVWNSDEVWLCYRGSGYWSEVCHGDDNRPDVPFPTHWMPLPEPPKDGASASEVGFIETRDWITNKEK